MLWRVGWLLLLVLVSAPHHAVNATDEHRTPGRRRAGRRMSTVEDTNVQAHELTLFHRRQAFLNELANGTFGGEGEFVEGRDFAPERHWQPHDLHIRELYDKYAKHPRAARQCLQNKPLFLAGSSYMRQLLLEMVKFLNGTAPQAYSSMDPRFQEVPDDSSFCCREDKKDLASCDASNPYYSWSQGVNATASCGLSCGGFPKLEDMRRGLCVPGRRLWSWENFHVQYQFLRYVRTHGMLELMLPRLQRVETHPGRFSNSPYKVLVMQMGVWDQLRHGMVGDCVTGDHGDPQSDSVNGKELEVARAEYGIDDASLTNKTEVYRFAVRMLLDQVRAGFDGMIVFYVEPPTFFGNKGETPCWIYDVIREEVSQPHRRFLVIDKKQYVTQGKAAAVRPLAHGYAGPIADALAKTLLVLLCAHDELGERSTVL